MRVDEGSRVEPQFHSTRYGTPTYCQLASTRDEITAEPTTIGDGCISRPLSAQTAANLRARLDEHTHGGCGPTAERCRVKHREFSLTAAVEIAHFGS